MSKYIIDVGDAYIRHGLERTLTIPVRINEHEDHWMDTRIPVTPYTEPDTEKIRKQGYNKGLDDIGNALRLLLFQYSNYTLQEIFGYDTARAVVEHFEGSEIVARIRCYEGSVKQDVETIRKEAYAEGYKEGMQLSIDDAKLKEEYRRGLDDAWEAARKIAFNKARGGLTYTELETIFGTDEMTEILDMSASETIEKIRQHEQEQEEQIQVGDEVRNIKNGWIAVVCNIDGECMTLMDTNGALGDGYDVNRFTKTGRHFPEIAAVLAKMKEES